MAYTASTGLDNKWTVLTLYRQAERIARTFNTLAASLGSSLMPVNVIGLGGWEETIQVSLADTASSVKAKVLQARGMSSVVTERKQWKLVVNGPDITWPPDMHLEEILAPMGPAANDVSLTMVRLAPNGTT